MIDHGFPLPLLPRTSDDVPVPVRRFAPYEQVAQRCVVVTFRNVHGIEGVVSGLPLTEDHRVLLDVGARCFHGVIRLPASYEVTQVDPLVEVPAWA